MKCIIAMHVKIVEMQIVIIAVTNTMIIMSIHHVMIVEMPTVILVNINMTDN